MKRKAVVLAIVVLIALLVVTPSLAAGPHNGQGQRHGALTMRRGGGGGGGSFMLYGEIESLDDEELTITVLGEAPAKYLDKSILVETTDTTRFKECVDGSSSRITFEDLVEGSEVRIAGTVDEDTGAFIAGSVIQYP